MNSMAHKYNTPLRTSKSGFVLVVVLWVLAILTVVTLSFGHRTMLERRATTYTLDQSLARMQARGAVQRGIVEIRNKAFEDYSDTEEWTSVSHLGQKWARPMDLYKEGGYFQRQPEAENDVVLFYIQDAESRISINSASQELLDNVPNISPTVRRRIMNRRMRGEQEGEPGSYFQAIEEIRYMQGVRDEHWFGDDRTSGLRSMLTLHGYMININTAPPEVLACIPGVDQAAISTLMNFRNGPDGKMGTADDRHFNDLNEDLLNKVGPLGDSLISLRQHCKVTSDYYIITGMATRRSGAVVAIVTATVQVMGNHASVIGWREGSFES